MGRKRKRECSDEKILRKLRKLEKKLRRRRRSSSSSESRPDPKSEHAGEPDIAMISEPDISKQVELDKTSTDQIPQPLESPMDTEGNNNTKVDEDNNKTAEFVHLDEDILTLFGDAPKEDSPVGKDTHIDIATRLQDILQNGLKKDFKDKTSEEYPVPGNCPLFKAPILNAEIKAAISDILQKKDASLAARQGQIGIALTALTKAMDILVLDKSETSQVVLKHVINACRLLCDSHFIDTKMRRNFLISTLNNKLKDTLKESKRDKNLFGENLPEKLKATKAITKTSQDLKAFKPKPNASKNTPSTSSANPNHLNWKHPQSNAQTAHRKTTATAHRTAGSSSESTRRPATSSGRATRTTAHYRNHKRS